jgi:TolA-binding protein
MKTTTLFNDCLTFDQLEAYALNKSNKLESAQTYKHISTCELCACAVNGFTAIPFSFSDVDAIHNQIDVRTNVTHANPLTFARVIIVAVSLAGIFGFYRFANSFSENKIRMSSKETVHISLNPTIKSEPMILSENRVEKNSKTEKRTKIIFKRPVVKNTIPVATIKSIAASLPEPAVNTTDIVNTEIFNSDVIYIYDLKITEYQKIYFDHRKNPFEMKGYVPASKENKNASANVLVADMTQTTSADKVLKKGLEYFAKGKYNKALVEFNLLLDLNPDDINSLFYSAVSYCQTGKCELAAKNLSLVLKNENNVFYPEAKWNLALVDLRSGDKTKAKEMLNEIVFEKGFYSKKAADKLKSL